MALELPEQADELVRVCRTRIAGALDTRPAAQRVDFQAGVLRDGRESGRARVIQGLLPSVFRKRAPGLLRLFNRRKVGQGDQRRVQAVEDPANLPNLPRVGRCD